MSPSPTTAAPYADLIAALALAGAQPLWDRYQRLTRRAPSVLAPARHWPWSRMEPLVERAVAEVAMEDAERRVLLLADPDLPGAATTGNLQAGLQTLMPGEVAHAHRHTIAALRYVMSGEGARTTVNDTVCPMAPGDLILTPSWTWHQHVHAGHGRMVWFDGLDLPLCAQLDTMFFEIAGPGATGVEPAPTAPAVAPWAEAVLGPDADNRFAYGAARARAVLESARPRADGSRWLRYTDGTSGGAVLPSLDCYLAQLAPGAATTAWRSTADAVVVVAQGSGRSQLGGHTIDWGRHDVFTLPHWQWARHQAGAEGATLFLMTDREFKAVLGYLREEERPGAA